MVNRIRSLSSFIVTAHCQFNYAILHKLLMLVNSSRENFEIKKLKQFMEMMTMA